MAMIAEYRTKSEALHQLWWYLHMSEKFSSGTQNPKQINIVLFSLYVYTIAVMSLQISKNMQFIS